MPLRRRPISQFCIGTQASLALSLPVVQSVDRLSKINRSTSPNNDSIAFCLEKLRNRIDGDGALPFEAKLGSMVVDGRDGIRWSDHDLNPPVFKQATELFQDGLTVRAVAAVLRISKTEAGRMRLQALNEGLLVTRNETDKAPTNGHDRISMESWSSMRGTGRSRSSPIQG
jgi:hypothetical protein